MKKIRKPLLIFRVIACTLACLACRAGYADDPYAAQRERWLQVAQERIPELNQEYVEPVATVELLADTLAFQGYRTQPCGKPEEAYGVPFTDSTRIIFDFGRHLTGTLTFRLDHHGRVSDAPVRLKFTFTEVPAELAAEPYPWPGSLSRAWFQDEIIVVEQVPAEITFPRRMSYRYVRVEPMGRSPYFDFSLSSAACTATTSAVTTPEPLPASASDLIREIDRVGLFTLRECMQTVYEDGPKRDRRLWIGDLYLEVLANNYSFRNHALTRRCLYLLAALAQEDGVLHSTVFERPEPHPQNGTVFLDYALSWNLTLAEYYKATGDTATVTDLWPVFLRQIEYTLQQIGDSGLYRADSPCWLFFDWKDKLDKQTAMQGLLIYTLREAQNLARSVGLEKSTAEYPSLIEHLSEVVYRGNYDPQTGLFLSGKNSQISWHSQVWMVLAGVVDARQGAEILRRVMAHPMAFYPGTPYATHFLVEAMIRAGMHTEARRYLEDYWGIWSAKARIRSGKFTIRKMSTLLPTNTIR